MAEKIVLTNRLASIQKVPLLLEQHYAHGEKLSFDRCKFFEI